MTSRVEHTDEMAVSKATRGKEAVTMNTTNRDDGDDRNSRSRDQATAKGAVGN